MTKNHPLHPSCRSRHGFRRLTRPRQTHRFFVRLSGESTGLLEQAINVSPPPAETDGGPCQQYNQTTRPLGSANKNLNGPHQISLTIWEQFSDEKPLLSIQQQERVSVSCSVSRLSCRGLLCSTRQTHYEFVMA